MDCVELRSLAFAGAVTSGTIGIADPRVLSEPLVLSFAEGTVSPAEKYRGAAEGRSINVSTGG